MSGLTRRSRVNTLAATSVFALVGATLAIAPSASAAPDGTGLVISEVSGGGGNAGATYTHDFIELYNPTNAPIDVAGWSVQWRSATGVAAATGVTPLTGAVPAGGYFLGRQSQGKGGTTALPDPDVNGTVAMGGTGGTAILSNATAAVNPGVGSFAGDAAVVDLVGVASNVWEGTAKAPATSNTTSVSRSATGADTDQNSQDFAAGAPGPQSIRR